jgi:hypothetical protein
VIALSCTSGPVGSLPPVDASVGPRVPSNHRPAGPVCPTGRGPGSLATGCAYDAGIPLACVHDSDCTTGKSGRCLPTPGVPCAPACSYDTCQSDADCAGKACICRTSGTDSTANACATGNCAIDSDCGPGGYCSPSGLPNACGIGYFCHTPGDTCLDNADCGSSQGCTFDPHALAWSCAMTCTQSP